MPFLIFAVEISSRKSVAFRKLTWIVNVFSFFLVVNYIIFVFFPLSFGESTFVKSLSFVPYIFLKPNCWKIREKWILMENTNTLSSSNDFIMIILILRFHEIFHNLTTFIFIRKELKWKLLKQFFICNHNFLTKKSNNKY